MSEGAGVHTCTFEEGQEITVTALGAKGALGRWRFYFQKREGRTIWLQADSLSMKGGLPKVGASIGMTAEDGHIAWVNGAVIEEVEGPRLDPVVRATLVGEWDIMVRRTTSRSFVDGRVDVIVPDPRHHGEVGILRGRFVDLSISGCRVRVVGTVAPGALVSIRFHTDLADQDVSIMAQVVRCVAVESLPSQRDLGIRFVRLHEETRKVLEAWLEELNRPEPVRVAS